MTKLRPPLRLNPRQQRNSRKPTVCFVGAHSQSRVSWEHSPGLKRHINLAAILLESRFNSKVSFLRYTLYLYQQLLVLYNIMSEQISFENKMNRKCKFDNGGSTMICTYLVFRMNVSSGLYNYNVICSHF